MMILTETNSQLVYQRALAATSTVWRSCQRHFWQPPILSGGPASRDISGESRRMGKGNENLTVAVELKEIFYVS
jgi:hypothetical protein